MILLSHVYMGMSALAGGRDLSKPQCLILACEKSDQEIKFFLVS
jgi:hypothetical protein